MSVTKSPRLNELRRREEEADRKKLAAVIGTLVFLCAAGLVLALMFGAGK